MSVLGQIDQIHRAIFKQEERRNTLIILLLFHIDLRIFHN